MDEKLLAECVGLGKELYIIEETKIPLQRLHDALFTALSWEIQKAYRTELAMWASKRAKA